MWRRLLRIAEAGASSPSLKIRKDSVLINETMKNNRSDRFTVVKTKLSVLWVLVSLLNAPVYSQRSITYDFPEAPKVQEIQRIFQNHSAQGISVRNAQALVYDEGLNKIILFGGANERRVLNETWEFSGGRWSIIDTGSPPPRTFPSMVYDSVRKRILMFGGKRSLFGKTASDQDFLDDFWEFDGKTWTQIKVPTPDARAEASATFDRHRQRVVLFGGYRIESGGVLRLSDTWEWDGISWRKRAEGIPTSRNGSAIAYDSVRRRTVLFGGAIKPGGATETWEWDGYVWSEVESARDEPRYNAAMVYDESRGVMVRFGGWNGSRRIGETSEFDGQKWTRLSIEGPSPRNHTTMVYDQKRKKIVLFGGHDGEFVYGDTWEFDGRSWREVISTGPVRRIDNGH